MVISGLTALVGLVSMYVAPALVAWFRNCRNCKHYSENMSDVNLLRYVTNSVGEPCDICKRISQENMSNRSLTEIRRVVGEIFNRKVEHEGLLDEASYALCNKVSKQMFAIT
jgi:hypothetical protein